MVCLGRVGTARRNSDLGAGAEVGTAFLTQGVSEGYEEVVDGLVLGVSWVVHL